MVEHLVNMVVNGLSGALSKDIIVLIVSMIPILELRGGILAAGPKFLNIAMGKAIPICIIGNLIPIPFILLLITKIFDWLKSLPKIAPKIHKLEEKAMSKSKNISKYEFWGLVLFVGIPLPGTGAWTGALIAALLGIKFKKAFPAIILGVLLAAVLMTILSYGIIGNL
ncbi:MAG: small multi-drug export protein [Lachnospiraceae bacterium]|nr:small multi-drug export protein [Lachnospiraceae bacterium]